MARLPPELLYNILGDIVADYIDLAITSSPQSTLPGQHTLPPSFSSILGQDIAQLPQDSNSDLNSSADRNQNPTQITEDVLRDRLRKHLDSFLHWAAEESLHPLPQNHIIPLLTVNRSFHHVLCKVLDDTLGSHEHPADRWAILKDLRREFRRTRTHHLPPLSVKTKYPAKTPLMMAYLRVCKAQHFLHDVKGLIFNPESDIDETAEEFAAHFRGSFTDLIPQPVLCGRVRAHMRLARIRIAFVERLTVFAKDIGEALVDTYQAVSINDDYEKEVTLDVLNKSIATFNAFEASFHRFTDAEGPYLAKNFHVFPAHIVRLMDVHSLFDIIADCRPTNAGGNIDDQEWLDEMSKVQSWGQTQLTNWDKFEEHPDYDEMDWSQTIFM